MSALVALGTVEGKRIEFGGALVLLGLDVRGRRGGYVEEGGLPLGQPFHEDAIGLTIGDEIDEGVRGELGAPIWGQELAVLSKLLLRLHLSLRVSEEREMDSNATLVHLIDDLFDWLGEEMEALGRRLHRRSPLGSAKEHKGSLPAKLRNLHTTLFNLHSVDLPSGGTVNTYSSFGSSTSTICSFVSFSST